MPRRHVRDLRRADVEHPARMLQRLDQIGGRSDRAAKLRRVHRPLRPQLDHGTLNQRSSVAHVLATTAVHRHFVWSSVSAYSSMSLIQATTVRQARRIALPALRIG